MHLEELCGAMIQTFKKYSGADGKDGELNQDELSKLLKVEFPSLSASGKDEDLSKEVMKAMDLDGDQKVSFREFAVFLARMSTLMEECES
ncbi:protein S100-P-like isoform X1 [Lissotriton helveticus]